MSEVPPVLQLLADLDHKIRLISGRIAHVEQEELALKERIKGEDQALARRREEHRKLRQTALDRATEVDATDAKIREYQHKLDHEIISYKEMEFLREQVQVLRKRLDQLSEDALQLMDAVEENARKLAEEEEKYKELRALLEGELQSLGKRRDELKKELSELDQKREDALAQLPWPIRQKYEQLRTIVPDPVVYVDGQSCSGCHLKLSEAIMVKLREGREVVTCENCSRFLLLRW